MTFYVKKRTLLSTLISHCYYLMCRYSRIKIDGQLRGRKCQSPKIIIEWNIKLDLQIFAINGMLKKSQNKNGKNN